MHSQEATQNGVSIKATDGGFPPWGALLGEDSGEVTLSQPQPSPRADDTQGSRGHSSTEARHSPTARGVSVLILPRARVTLCAANPHQQGRSHGRCCQLDTAFCTARSPGRLPETPGDLAADLCKGCPALAYPVHPAPRAASFHSCLRS